MTTKGVILEQPAPSATPIDPGGVGANPPLTPETEAEQTAWQQTSPWVHGLLGVASFVPGLSVVTGAVDAAIYTAEGELVEAGIAAASMIPGGKVVTTAGKVAKGAVGMAKGAGTAAKIAKGTHEAEEVLKAARKTEEAAQVAREAKAAEEAREAAAGARKAKKEVTIKAREHKVPCFHPFDKKKFMRMNKNDQNAYLKEMAAQLKRQEQAINNLTAIEYKAARDAFAAVNRNPLADAAQADFRNRLAVDIKKSIGKSLVKGGMNTAQAKAVAITRTQEVMGKLAALHDPDMVAGGWMHPNPTGVGRADVNSSIGASWNQNDRISGLDHEANKAIERGLGNQKMNVKLEPCRGKGMR
ncbi:MAG TPA: polymorphic toxin type 15 domain-containing protein [Duganella sp.]|nr:polymorphic toxin type 15 domain-containing protein [Duganella sp.]